VMSLSCVWGCDTVAVCVCVCGGGCYGGCMCTPDPNDLNLGTVLEIVSMPTAFGFKIQMARAWVRI